MLAPTIGAVADRARFLVREGRVAVRDVRLPHDSAELFARLDDVEATSLTSLVHATRRLRESLDEDVTHLRLYPYGIPPQSFWPSQWDPLPVTITFFGEDQVRVSIALEPQRVLDEPGLGTFSPLQGLAARRGIHVSGVGYPSVASRGRLEPSLAVPPRGRTVADCLDLAHDVTLLLEAVLGSGGFHRSAVADLIRAGRPDLLIGQPENQWFDAKRTPYIFGDVGARFEFAKDVAAFGNTGGGLIVCGLSTTAEAQGDVVRAVRPFDLSLVNRRTMQDVIRGWIHPTPINVRIELIETDGSGRGIVLVEIPEQPPQVLPLLVARGHLGRGLSTQQMCLPVRDGEETDYSSVGEIHALLVAGRVAFASSPSATTPPA